VQSKDVVLIPASTKDFKVLKLKNGNLPPNYAYDFYQKISPIRRGRGEGKKKTRKVAKERSDNLLKDVWCGQATSETVRSEN